MLPGSLPRRSAGAASFTDFQSLDTRGASAWAFFEIAGERFLAVAESTDGSTGDLDSQIFRWDGTEFVSGESARGTSDYSE